MALSNILCKNSVFRRRPLPGWGREMLFRNWGVILCRRPAADGPSSQFYCRCHNFERNSSRDMCSIRSAIFLRVLCSSPAKPAGYICPTRKTASPMFCQLRTSTSRRETSCCQIAGSSPSCPRKTIFRDTIEPCRYLWYLRLNRGTVCSRSNVGKNNTPMILQRFIRQD